MPAASAALNVTSPRGTGTPWRARMAFAWYSWIFMTDRNYKSYHGEGRRERQRRRAEATATDSTEGTANKRTNGLNGLRTGGLRTRRSLIAGIHFSLHAIHQSRDVEVDQ